MKRYQKIFFVFESVNNLELQKMCKTIAYKLRFKLGFMRGFQKCQLFGGRVTKSVHVLGVQKRFAKKFAQFFHLSWDIRVGS